MAKYLWVFYCGSKYYHLILNNLQVLNCSFVIYFLNFFIDFPPFRSDDYIKVPASFWKEFIINQKVSEVQRLTFLSADTLSFHAVQTDLTFRNS